MACTLPTITTLTGPGVDGNCVISVTLPTQSTELIKCQCLTEAEVSWAASGIVDLGQITFNVAGIVAVTAGTEGDWAVNGTSFHGFVVSAGGATFEAGSTSVPTTSITIQVTPAPAAP